MYLWVFSGIQLCSDYSSVYFILDEYGVFRYVAVYWGTSSYLAVFSCALIIRQLISFPLNMVYLGMLLYIRVPLSI